MQQIPHLNSLRSKYEAQGLTVIGVTGESSARIKPFIKQKNMEYIVAIGGANQYRARSIPAAWLISATGKVLWQGHPASLRDNKIQEALNEVRLPPSLTLPRKLAKAQRYTRASRLDSAIAEIDRFLTRSKDEASNAEARAGKRALIAFGKKLLGEADSESKAGNWDTALKRLDACERYFKKHDLGKQAKAKRVAWKKDPKTRLEVEAAVALITAERYAAAGSKTGAMRYAAKIAIGKKYAQTQMRAKAERMLQELRSN